MTFSFEIITPEKVIFKDDISEVIVPSVNGELAILPNHASLVTKISEGLLTIKKDGKEHLLAITGGFLEVNNNKVSILADYAIRSEEIEESKAQEARKRAEKAMEEKTSDRDFALAESQFKRAILELKVAHKRRNYKNNVPS